MPIYSHSRLSTFEQCPYKYKLHYIDKVETDVEQSIEAFLGSRAHDTLEKLYKDLDYQKKNTLEELLTYLNEQWEKNWTESIVIVKEEYNQDNYLKMAEKYITDYYKRYEPFNQGKTISIEDRILIKLDNSGDYKLQGYIDRLTEVKDGYYQIHDYKTNSRLPLPQYIENDRQLALYSIGVKERYPDVKDVRLIWHFLKFDKEIDSTRTDDELEDLKKNTIKLIDTIENAEEYPANTSILCDWCEYKPVCKQWSHLYKIKEKPENEYLSDPGVKLVNKYAELKSKKKITVDEIDTELKKLEEAIIIFSEKENVEVVFGAQNKAKISINEKISFPSKNDKKRNELNSIIKEAGIWEEISELDVYALNRKIKEENWSEELIKKIKEFQSIEKSKRIYLSKIKGKEE